MSRASSQRKIPWPMIDLSKRASVHLRPWVRFTRRWGAQLEDSTYKSKYRCYFSEQVRMQGHAVGPDMHAASQSR